MKNRSTQSKSTNTSRVTSGRKNSGGSGGYSIGFSTLFCVTITLTAFLIWSRMHFFSSLLEQVNQPYEKMPDSTKTEVTEDNKVRLRERVVNQTGKESETNQIPVNSNNKSKHRLGSKKLKIAFAITMNHDGNFQDGAAVLAYSIYATNMTKRHDVSFVAFVHPNVVTSRPVLAKIGYHVIEAPTPIK